MTIKWLIEDGVFPEATTNAIINILDSNNIPYKRILWCVDNEFKANLNSSKDIYIPYGSVGMIRELSDNYKEAKLGMWYNPENLSWGAINEHWNKHLLNADSEVVTLGDFRSRLSYFYKKFGKVIKYCNFVFIKPFENDKSFNGMVLMEPYSDDTIGQLLNDKRFSDRVNVDTKIVVSSPKFVDNEWRLFVVNGKIITSSQYNRNRKKCYEEGAVSGVIEFALEVIKVWQPDYAFSLDICESDSKFYIMEIGCINCSDLYAANKVDFFTKIPLQLNII